MIPLRDLNPSRNTPWITWSVMLVCVVVFVFKTIQPAWVQGQILENFALVPGHITAYFWQGGDSGVLFTVLSSMFMHAGWLHLIGNMWFLRIFGDNVEDHFGTVRYAFFFIVCGIAAAIAQVVINPYSEVPMVGASGAIAGVLAAYLVLYPRARVVTIIPLVFVFPVMELPAFLMIAVWFLLQFFAGVMSLGAGSGGGVAYWAHIGGFAMGLLLAFALRKTPTVVTRERTQPRWGVDADWD